MEQEQIIDIKIKTGMIMIWFGRSVGILWKWDDFGCRNVSLAYFTETWKIMLYANANFCEDFVVEAKVEKDVLRLDLSKKHGKLSFLSGKTQ